MKDLTIAELSQPVRDFLAAVEEEHGAVIRGDAEGRMLLSITPSRPASKEARDRAMERLRDVQRRVGDDLRTLDVSEDEFDRAARDDDRILLPEHPA